VVEMKKSIVLIVAALLSTSFANEVVVLETMYPDSWFSFGNQYSEFEFAESETGDLIALYARMGQDWSPSYLVKQYPENESAQAYSVGAFYGMGGCFNPTICGFEDQKLLVQEYCLGDIVTPFGTYKLRSLDLTPNNNHAEQYFYTDYDTQISRIWKIDSTHAFAFCKKWDWDEGVKLFFISNIDLFNEPMWPEDSSFIFHGDTVVVIDNVLSYSQAKLETSDTYLSIYQLTDSDSLGFVCVNHDSAIAQEDSILPVSTSKYIIHSRNDSFWALNHPISSSTINLWTFNTNSLEASTELVYTSPGGSNECLASFHSTLLDDEVVLQIPVLKDQTSTEVTNWYSLINKRISLNDYSIITIDTIFVFEPQTNIIRNRIINDGQNTHSLIATRTPEYSRLYYYGGNSLVNIDQADFQVPTDLAISNVYPNPFNSHLTIDISLPTDFKGVTLDIFDLRGQLVWSNKSVSTNSVAWNGLNIKQEALGSGIYLIRLSDGVVQDSRKIMLIK